ncbi:MAG TPA: DUF1801 domain-containing protein, partial [Kofleriaceae bacterium]
MKKTAQRTKRTAKSATKVRASKPAKRTTKARASKRTAKPSPKATKRKKVVLLSGGNPQIAKGDGDAPVQAYYAALQDWKRAVGKRVDALIVKNVPGVKKAVKWNSPFYGVEGQGFFLGLHVFTKYIKLAFFRGSSLEPIPPGESKHPETRYLDIRETDKLDEAQLGRWF